MLSKLISSQGCSIQRTNLSPGFHFQDCDDATHTGPTADNQTADYLKRRLTLYLTCSTWVPVKAGLSVTTNQRDLGMLEARRLQYDESLKLTYLVNDSEHRTRSVPRRANSFIRMARTSAAGK
ncbi:uncharacterized protein TRIVIDRAFT_227580 [Trichoderma virens Gv29-8]|uniref:Uncharacterized protein n=1 Tax=Hypocrea virens (strain Gv29-8 / FGSC 10586) TaxID=413071 RepID=G9N9W1_HYPVG|nr:uncharacterized protein TRIVIDRAFT_227580 [Trichoderma virens Gv29-8]EHK16729.1 hypothetical protein TRIVIDRAFT_227580 [Trichoderma virens Gv29-8]UKZ51893.1 hypothetical protein TrVGV298_005658 [Trichoderma virens]